MKSIEKAAIEYEWKISDMKGEINERIIDIMQDKNEMGVELEKSPRVGNVVVHKVRLEEHEGTTVVGLEIMELCDGCEVKGPRKVEYFGLDVETQAMVLKELARMFGV